LINAIHPRESKIQKDLLIVTALATRATIEHELFHASDNENGLLSEFHKYLDGSIDMKGVSLAFRNNLYSAVFELRAYNHQVEWTRENIRETEWFHRSSGETFAVNIRRYSQDQEPYNIKEYKRAISLDTGTKELIYRGRLKRAMESLQQDSSIGDTLVKYLRLLLPENSYLYLQEAFGERFHQQSPLHGCADSFR
jgi:hypothetical protein